MNAPDLKTAPYSIVLTSCGRFDLLERTLESLFAHLDEAPAATIIVEDSSDPRVADHVGAVSGPLKLLVNEQNLGQMASIDKAYEAVETPLIFHCEDDWEFFRKGFIAESRALLSAFDDVSLISLRAKSDLNPLLRRQPEATHHDIPYFLADPDLHPEYFGYAFNPGLRRREDYLRLGPFRKLGHEREVSYAFKKAGYRMGYLGDPAVRHLGDGRHVHDAKGPKRPTNAFERLQRSVEKRWQRLKRAFGNV